MNSKKGMAVWVSLWAVVALGMASAASAETPLDTQPEAEIAEGAVETGVLSIRSSKSRSDDVGGRLATSAGVLDFSTVSRKGAKSAAFGETPDAVIVSLEVNGAEIRHAFDYSTGAVTVTTANGVRLGRRELDLFASFQPAIAKHLDSLNLESMSTAQDALWRLSEMYSEAPLNHMLEKSWVIERTVPQTEPNPVDTLFDAKPATGAELVGSLAKACAGESHNSFTDLHNGHDVCRSDLAFSKNAGHDYCQGPGALHGYLLTNQRYGCSSSQCYGRCGGGCGLDGRGAWMHDCLRHDICNRSHNGNGCDDEWREAADDYLNGPIHCAIRGCHT